MTDQRDNQAHDIEFRHENNGKPRRAYVAPELIEYGTVAKLTQGNNGSVSDFGPFMSMKA